MSNSRFGIRSRKGNIRSLFEFAAYTMDSDSVAFINASGITDSTQATAIDSLVVDLKDYSLWTKMKAVYPIVGGTSTTHKFNLKDPRDLNVAFRLAFFGGWTHGSTGLKGNRNNTYADTYLSSSGNLTQNSNHISYYARTSWTDSFESAMGANKDGVFGDWHDLTTSSGGQRFRIGGMIDTSYSGNGTGFVTGVISSSNSRKIYKDGVLQTTNTANQNQIMLSNSFYLGAISYSGGVQSLYSSGKEFCFFSIGDALTDSEVENLNTAVQKFQTTLNRI